MVLLEYFVGAPVPTYLLEENNWILEDFDHSFYIFFKNAVFF